VKYCQRAETGKSYGNDKDRCIQVISNNQKNTKGVTELIRLFFKLGTIAFGGPAAHIAMMEDEVVHRRKWITREHFTDLVGATNLIPGPNSTEMAIHIGYVRGGLLGLIVSGLSFILPAVIITGILAWVYVRFGSIPQVEPFLFGIKPAVISVILVAVVRLGKTAAKNTQLTIIGTGRFAKELGIDSGIDPSFKSLEIAKKRGIRVKRAKGERLPFKDKSFGAVFMLFTLCFVEDPEKVLFEAQRVLKIGGRLIVGIINRESPWGQLYLKKKANGHPLYGLATFYNIFEVVKMIEKTGMAVEAYSSTLCQPPSEIPYKELVHNELIENAGFVCILARKIHS
jgi:chromate transport protein ChrA